MQAICLTAWNRPDTQDKMLQSLQQVRRLEHWTLFVRLEPSGHREKMRALLIDAALPCRMHLYNNGGRLGVRQNPLTCLQQAAEAGAERFLLLEDDLELSADSLEFVELATTDAGWDHAYQCGNLHFSTCFNTAHLQCWDPNIPGLAEIALSTLFLSSLGLFFSRRQFDQFIAANWNRTPLQLRNFAGGAVCGWDCALNEALLLGRRPCLQSLLPRVRHLGVEGVHSDAALHQRSYAHAGLHQSSIPLTHLQCHNLEGINNDPPEGSEHWGHLLRMASQLWTLEQTALARQRELARCSRDLFNCFYLPR